MGSTDSLECKIQSTGRSAEAVGWTWTCSSLSEEVAGGGGAAAQAGHVSCCTAHLHSLGREHNLGPKSFNQYPSPRPLTPQQPENL